MINLGDRAGGVTGRARGVRCSLDHGEIVSATLASPPPKLGVTHWSSRLLANQLGDQFLGGGQGLAGVWDSAVAGETIKFSTDPELVAKVTDVVGCILTRSRMRLCCASTKISRSKP